MKKIEEDAKPLQQNQNKLTTDIIGEKFSSDK